MNSLLKYLNKFGDDVSMDVRLNYSISGQPPKWKNMKIVINSHASRNAYLLKNVVENKFYNNSSNNDEHYGRANIHEIIIENMQIIIEDNNITDLLMRFSDGNDCVFKEIYLGIKDFRGYKNYSIDKLKNEFVQCDIYISNGVSFNNIKEWHKKFNHHINFYFYGPGYNRIDKIKSGNFNFKIPQLVFLYNNNHCIQILNDDIKRSIVYGDNDNINKFNPAKAFEFKTGIKYPFYMFNDIQDKIVNNNLTDEVILMEPHIEYNEDGKSRSTLIFVVNNYHSRKFICDSMKECTGLLNFDFKNQSYASIGMTLHNVKNPPIPKSYYNSDNLNIIDNYYPEVVHFGNEFKKNWKYKIGCDYPKSYSNAVSKYFRGVKLGILNVCDNFVEDEFIIKKVDDDKFYFIDGIYYKGIKWSDKCFCPYFIIEEFLKLDIKITCFGYTQYSEYIIGDSFSELVDYVYRCFDSDESKSIINSFFGLLNKKFTHESTAFLTRDHDVAINASIDGFNVDFIGGVDNRLYVCKDKNKERINGDTNFIHQSIIWGGILNLLEIVSYIDTNFDEYEIIGANTDAIYFGANKVIENKNNGSFNDKSFKIGINEFRDNQFVKFENRELPIFNKKKWKRDKNGSFLMNDGSGNGKSEMGIRENIDKKILGLAFENSAVNNLNEKCKDNGIDNYLCKTIHVALGMSPDKDDIISSVVFNDFDVIIIDEFFRIDPILQSKLYFKLKQFNGKIILIGDESQFGYICEKGREFNYKYSNCDFVGDLVDWNYYNFSKEEMDYKIENGKCRFDRELYEFITHLKNNGKFLDYKFKPIDPKLKKKLLKLTK